MENFDGDEEGHAVKKVKTDSQTSTSKPKPITPSASKSPGATQGKRKREDAEDEPTTKDVSKQSSAVKEPKKFKRAFGFFVKAKRAEAEAQIGDASVCWLHRAVLLSHL